MIDLKFFSQMESAIKNHESFCIQDQSITIISKTDIFSRLFHYYKNTDPEWFKNNAPRLTKFLENTSSESSNKTRVVNLIKSFLNQYKNLSETEEYKKCDLALLSFRLGIPVNALNEEINSGFYAFAAKYHLYNSLDTFNHQLLVNERTHEISIKYKNEYIPWLYAKNHIDSIIKEQKPNKDETCALNLYGQEGIQNENRYHFRSLRPLLKGDTTTWANHFIKDPLFFDEQNKAYITEYCSSATKNAPRVLGGDHSWIRLYSFEKTDEKIIGCMYSIGLYRPAKHHYLFDTFWKPFRIKKGFITDEVTEVWGINNEIKTIAKQVSKTCYNSIIDKIETLKNENLTPYQHFHLNCDTFTCDLAKIDGVNLATKRHFFELFLFSKYSKSWNEKLKTLPKPIVTVAKAIVHIFRTIMYLLTPVFSLIYFLAGAASIDKKAPKCISIPPIFNSFYDFFKIEKLEIYSPWLLVNDVKEEIENWRQEEIKELDLSTHEGAQKKNAIIFSFPPSFKLNS